MKIVSDYKYLVKTMKNNFNIFLIFFSLFFCNLSSLFAQMNSGIMEIEEEVANLLIPGSSEVTNIAHATEERGIVINENEKACWDWADKSACSSAEYQVKASEAEEAKETILAASYKEAVAILESATNQFKKAAEIYMMGKVSEGNSLFWASRSLCSSADYQVKACEAEDTGKIELAAGYREAAAISQRAADQRKLSAESYASGKDSEGGSWSLEAQSLQKQADYQSQASEAQEGGKMILATSYREVAKTLQHAADQWKLSAKVHAVGKKSEANSWYWAGNSFQSQADYQIKVIEAENAEQSILAAGYKEAAVTLQYAADMWKKSAEAKAIGRNNEGVKLGNSGEYYQKKANYQVKACESENVGKTALAASYGEIVATLQNAIDRWKLSLAAHAEGKEKEGNSWHYSGNSFQLQADYLAKVCEANAAGKIELAAGYKEAVATSQYAADMWEKSAESYAAGKHSEAIELGNYGERYQKKAGFQAKASELEDIDNIKLSTNYREAAGRSLRSVYDQEKKSLQLKAECEAKACEIETSENIGVAACFREIAAIYQRAIDQFKQSVKAYATGKENEYNSWYWSGVSLHTKADYKIKVIEAENTGQSILAAGYREVAGTLEEAAEEFKQSALAYVVKEDRMGEGWKNKGKYLQKKAGYQAKACKLENNGKITLGVGYREAIKMLESAFYDLGVQSGLLVFRGENGELHKCFYDSYDSENAKLTSECLQLQEKNQVKACEAEEEGKGNLTIDYKAAVVFLKRALDVWEQIHKIKGSEWQSSRSRDEFLGEKFIVDLFFEQQINCQEKAIEALEAGKDELKSRYRKVLETSLKASEYCMQKALLEVAIKKDKASKKNFESKDKERLELSVLRQYLELKIDKQIKDIEKAEEKKLEASNRMNSSIIADKNLDLESNIKRQRVDSSTRSKALSLYCYKWLAETRSTAEQGQILSDYVMDVLKRGADHKLVSAFEKYWDVVREAHELGDDPQALAWIQVAEEIQRFIEDSIKWREICRSRSNSSRKLYDIWEDAVQSMKKVVECRGEYIQAEELSKVPEIVSGWKKIIKGSESAADYYRKAAEACALNNEQEYERFSDTAKAMKENVKKLEAAITALEKSLSTVTKPEIVTLWKRAVEQYEISAEFGLKVAEAELAGNVEEVTRLKEIANALEIAAKEAITAAENEA